MDSRQKFMSLSPLLSQIFPPVHPSNPKDMSFSILLLKCGDYILGFFCIPIAQYVACTSQTINNTCWIKLNYNVVWINKKGKRKE